MKALRTSGAISAFIVALALLGIVWVVNSTPAFQECVHNKKSGYEYSSLYKDHSRLKGMLVRTRLTLTCGGHFIDTYHDAINTLATICVAFFTLALWISTHRLWKAGEKQIRVAIETRNIAEAALGRPYIFFEFVSHTFEDWREGNDTLWFRYRFANYGTAPAIVQEITASAVLSRGPMVIKDNEENHLIHAFPNADELYYFSRFINRVDFTAKRDEESIGFIAFKEFIGAKPLGMAILPRETTGLFGTDVLIPNFRETRSDASYDELMAYFHNVTSGQATKGGFVRPWLLGYIRYEDPFGGTYGTSFCIDANSDGSFSQNEGPPYNERT